MLPLDIDGRRELRARRPGTPPPGRSPPRPGTPPAGRSPPRKSAAAAAPEEDPAFQALLKSVRLSNRAEALRSWGAATAEDIADPAITVPSMMAAGLKEAEALRLKARCKAFVARAAACAQRQERLARLPPTSLASSLPAPPSRSSRRPRAAPSRRRLPKLALPASSGPAFEMATFLRSGSSIVLPDVDDHVSLRACTRAQILKVETSTDGQPVLIEAARRKKTRPKVAAVRGGKAAERRRRPAPVAVAAVAYDDDSSLVSALGGSLSSLGGGLSVVSSGYGQGQYHVGSSVSSMNSRSARSYKRAKNDKEYLRFYSGDQEDTEWLRTGEKVMESHLMYALRYGGRDSAHE